MSTNAGVNKVILLGEVKSEPTSKNQGSNNPYSCFILSTQETIKKGKENICHIEKHQIKAVKTLLAEADIVLQVGQVVYVEGKIETSSYIDQERIKRYDVFINASKIELVKSANFVNL